MKSLKKCIVSLITVIAACGGVFAFAEETPPVDLSASVSVKLLFKMDIDKSVISFGRVLPGEWKNLGEGSYYNQVTCQSNNGKIWYLLISLSSPLTGARHNEKIPANKLKYMPGWTNGTGTVHDQYTFKEFGTEDSYVYTSNVEDAIANPLYIQFQYGVNVPDNGTADDYSATVVYTMMEML